MNASILLADDDASLRFVLSQALTKEGFQVRATGNVATLEKWVKDGEGDVVLSDVYMGDENVFDALPGLRAARPGLPVIVMSGQSTVSTALSAANTGAFDYLPKPFDLDDLVAAVRRALAKGPDAKARAQASKAEKEEKLPLIGRAPAMQEVYRTMARVAATDLPVLIEGETGAGKERVARAIHEHSRRSTGPFLSLSLAGLSGSRLEEELFGTNGKFSQGQGGALFLEDVDELPREAQARLVGMLQTGERDGPPKVRLLAAAQRSLSAAMRAGTFRQDLFYRLSVVTIRLPPLRDRLDDIADLARAFLVRARREGLSEKMLEADAIELLKTHDWPGNVRELENFLRRIAALQPSPIITVKDIDRELAAGRVVADGEEAENFEQTLKRRLQRVFAAAAPDLPPAGLYDRVLAEVERPLIQLALKATKGNRIRAAAMLGINRNTLRKKIQVLGVRMGTLIDVPG